MSVLPGLAQLEFNEAEISEPAQQRVHATLDWDFERGDFRLKDGGFVRLEGRAYLMVWIQNALRTVRDTLLYRSFGSDFGSEHHRLIGQTYKPSFTREEYKRYITEALLQNDAITDVGNFSFEQVNATMFLRFDVQSIYGTTDGEVRYQT